MKISAVIFDCDGVVVDSEGPTFDLLGADLARYGLMLSNAEMHDRFLGGTVQGIFDSCRQQGIGLPDDWVQDFYGRVYDLLAKGTPLIPGILNVLNALDRRKIPYAIGSNGSALKMKVTLGQHDGLIDRFKGHIYSSQDLARPKPAPDLYLHCAQSLGVDAAECVVIEDSPTGARAAKAAGMRCFGYAPHGSSALEATGAQVFRDMDTLPQLLQLWH